VLTPSQKAAPHIAPHGRIILFSTTQTAATTVTPNYLAYCASKGAIEQLVRVLSKDLARKGIMVNAVSPGPTATDLFMTGKPEGVIKMISSLNPQGRLGKPEEIAETVNFLASPASSWVTGQVIRVNGGMA
jgi:3-oxoacyl-[acyl-carrier protein] reductase